MTHKDLPRKAKVLDKEWIDDGYGGVWCKIEEISYSTTSKSITLSLIHPDYGGFAWVNAKDCEFK